MNNQDILILILFVFLVPLFFWLLAKLPIPTKREYGVNSVTIKGEVVRSKAEKIISGYLVRNNINYVYEPEVKGKGLFFDYRIGYPDFYLSDYDVYIEYWGLVDVDDKWTRERYVKRMKKKMAQYYRNNLKFISIYPDNLNNLDWIFRRKFKKVTGYDLPN